MFEWIRSPIDRLGVGVTSSPDLDARPVIPSLALDLRLLFRRLDPFVANASGPLLGLRINLSDSFSLA